MADNMLRIAGRDETGIARPIKTDGKGNLGSKLHSRSELITFNSNTIIAKKTSSIINRFDELSNYSAIIVSVVPTTSSNIRMIANWYVQKPGEANGVQVTSDEIMSLATVVRYSTGYLEIKGTQLSIVVANGGETDIEVTVHVMGIR